ncbi:hypothetical protein MMC13_001341 [Lambiella insularis]|nr:hypothetical protein [Lambiella insularis]
MKKATVAAAKKPIAPAVVAKTPAASKPKKPAAVPAKKTTSKATKGKTASKATKGKTATTATTAAPPKANATKKRKADDEDDKPPAKKARAPPIKKTKAKVVINHAPTKKLDVYVFGEGSSGELGLGSVGNVVDVKRPRLNPNLSAAEVGVVQIAVGGMHVAALTHDNKILTWGVNDQGALGRDTAYEGNLRDIDDDSESEVDNTGINPRESTPTAASMENVPEGTVFTQVAAGDSVTFALTDDGYVYGCGTFRSNEGILGFSLDVVIQKTLTLVASLKNITSIVCGDNHVLALNNKGNVFAWGSGQQNQLGRRVVERTRMNGLIPREFGLPKNKITYLACGAYHSLAVDKSGKVWGWGLNSYGETGIPLDAGEDDAAILKPQQVTTLAGKEVICMAGGAHHSIAVTAKGECLSWGRMDGCQSGIKVESIPEEDMVRDEHNAPRILAKPMAIPGLGTVVHAAAGTDSNVVVNDQGKAFSWGFSGNYQTGQGTTDDVEVATMIDNTATRQKKLVWSGAGGQFSMLASAAE